MGIGRKRKTGNMEEVLLNQLIRLQLTAASADEEQLNKNTELRDRAGASGNCKDFREQAS